MTPAGLAYVDRMSQEKMVERSQPHIVTAIDLTDGQGQTLLHKRSFQPFINLTGFPSGKIHDGETILQAAQRELQEKTGLQDIPLTHRGMVYLETMVGAVSIGKVLYHLFQGHVAQALPVASPPLRGESFWDDATKYHSSQLMPGFRRMKELLDTKKDLFFAEITEELQRPTITPS